jgi:phenylalanyl-tRNA synthetase alpha chain
MSDLTETLSEIRSRFAAALEAAHDEAALEAARVAFLGRSGEVTLLRRRIGTLPPAERPAAGMRINETADELERMVNEARERLRLRAYEEERARRIDVTFPAIEPTLGSIHPIRRVLEDLCTYFERHGFTVVLGPELEPEYYTFDALNIPPDHPAREGFDSFFVGETLLLRPHTSPMQIRTMQAHRPPVAILAPGRCYRRDAVDARHSFMFHQCEGLLVAPGIHFGHLKGMLEGMCRMLFGPDQRVRLRPSYFPFTEPSAEVETTCPRCHGTAGECRLCGGAGWIELGGAGMVHPNVLREVGYDPNAVSGWAFGVGIERLAIVRYDVDDIRRFFDNDPDFLEQLQ